MEWDICFEPSLAVRRCYRCELGTKGFCLACAAHVILRLQSDRSASARWVLRSEQRNNSWLTYENGYRGPHRCRKRAARWPSSALQSLRAICRSDSVLDLAASDPPDCHRADIRSSSINDTRARGWRKDA